MTDMRCHWSFLRRVVNNEIETDVEKGCVMTSPPKIPKAAIFGWFLVLFLVGSFVTLLQYLRHEHPPLTSDEVRDADAVLTTVSPPQDEDVCFSPDEPCDLKLIKLVDSAQSSVDIAIYDINLTELIQHIVAKAKTTQVRVVVDRRQASGSSSRVDELVSAGVALRYGHQRGIMHDKFIVVDRKVLELGSFNFTNHAARANQENQLYLTTPAIVGRYAARFEKIWASAE